MNEELKQLREEVAKLRERIAVLEQVNWRNMPIGPLPSQWPVYEPHKPTPWEPHLSRWKTTCQS